MLRWFTVVCIGLRFSWLGYGDCVILLVWWGMAPNMEREALLSRGMVFGGMRMLWAHNSVGERTVHRCHTADGKVYNGVEG